MATGTGRGWLGRRRAGLAAALVTVAAGGRSNGVTSDAIPPGLQDWASSSGAVHARALAPVRSGHYNFGGAADHPGLSPDQPCC